MSQNYILKELPKEQPNKIGWPELLERSTKALETGIRSALPGYEVVATKYLPTSICHVNASCQVTGSSEKNVGLDVYLGVSTYDPFSKQHSIISYSQVNGDWILGSLIEGPAMKINVLWLPKPFMVDGQQDFKGDAIKAIISVSDEYHMPIYQNIEKRIFQIVEGSYVEVFFKGKPEG